ncbi:hypothetical protein [Frankia sp. ACN1ag]|uniref:hypothetical protein n=1 Tax=Frankia sp. ACN1ag TaxID=102891 RepID=UPI00128EC793|nr:hypothetical protein [Frankia sp. ACN1ag]
MAVPYRVAGRDGFVPRFASPDVDVEDVAARCIRIAAAGADQYTGVQLLGAIPARGRGGAADTAGLSALAVDVDVEGDGHAATTDTGLPLPPSQEAAVGILAGLPDPTYLVATGGGVHAWWIFNRHAAVDLVDAKRIVRGWSDLVRGRAHGLGWHVDQTGDLARVLRLPGTINYKYPGRPVVEIVASGPRHSLDELASLIPAQEPEPERSTAFVRPASGGADAAEVTARWSAETDWATLLEPAGWTCSRDNCHGERHWTRPGKTSGTSAVSHDDPPVLHVFTSGSELPVGTSTKLDVYAGLHHGGDVRAAWHTIASLLAAAGPNVAGLARFVADGGPAERTGGRLVWAARQIATEADRNILIRQLIRAAVDRGLPLDTAARAAVRGLRSQERTAPVGH